MASSNFHRFSHGHQDLVLSIDYNLYGTRLATASSDHRVKVWDRNDRTSQWTVTDVWTAHDAEVTEVRWNGPLTGEHLGTIGEDGLLRIWAEDVNEAPNSGRRFRKICEQVSATAVPYMSLDFKNIGTETYLAVITRDGYFTVCEPEDHDDLSSWRVMWSDYLCKTPLHTEETGFRIGWHKEKLPAWPAVLAGLDRRSLSLAVSVGSSVRVFRTDKDRKFYIAATLEGSRDLVRDVAWSNGSMRGFDTIATASRDGCIRVYELHTPGVSSLTAASGAEIGDKESIMDNGRPHTVRPARSGIGAGLAGGTRGRRDDAAGAPGAVKQDPKVVAEIEAHGGSPWRVSWSQMGDILVSTGDDGAVVLWKKAVDGKWLEAAEIDAMQSSQTAAHAT